MNQKTYYPIMAWSGTKMVIKCPFCGAFGYEKDLEKGITRAEPWEWGCSECDNYGTVEGWSEAMRFEFGAPYAAEIICALEPVEEVSDEQVR